MSSAPDLLLKDRLEQQIATVQAHTGMLDTVFADLSTGARNQIKRYMAATDLDVRLGWTQQTTRMPSVAIILPTEQEAQQFVGSEPGDTLDAHGADVIDGAYIGHEVTQFRGSLDCAVYAANATETTWIVSLLKWLLLTMRADLESAGITEQQITVTDFMPSNEYPQPDHVYTRVLKLTYVDYYDYERVSTDPGDILDADSVVVINESDS